MDINRQSTAGRNNTDGTTDGSALVSVIIPTLNAGASIGDCLTSVERQSYRHIEIVLADGGSGDATKEIAKGFGVRFVPGSYRRSSARQHGAKQARGRYLLFLDADQMLDRSVVSECVELSLRLGVAAVKIPERDLGTGVWATCRWLERQLMITEELTYPRFFTRSVYLELGGHSEGLEDFMEDRDLYLRFRSAGYASDWCNACVVNDLGTVNPFTLGIKGARAARDSAAYYRRNGVRGETPLVVIKARFKSVLEKRAMLGNNVGATMLLPIYISLAYGPRLIRTLIGSLTGV
jgi:glycosyltransferase involved in cell wall biosynthesis